ncbi:MAG TPA: hypothetical protein P5313_15185 [Spirochaetia bacterium]|nr:hypothetical protein [Spirochaetia bacterium]
MIRYEFSAEASRIVRSEIRELLAWSRRADTISFGGGLPDPSLFPVEDLERICAEVLGRKGYLALQYAPPASGFRPSAQPWNPSRAIWGSTETRPSRARSASSPPPSRPWTS